MVEETIRKQSTIAALSNATILHDPTLVEDLSDLRSVPRVTADEADQSVSGSVVITKRIPPVMGERIVDDSKYESNIASNTNNNNDKHINPDYSRKEPRITSMASSYYSDDNNENIDTSDTEPLKEHVDDEDIGDTSEDNDIPKQDLPLHTLKEANQEEMDLLESQLDREISEVNERASDHSDEVTDTHENNTDDLYGTSDNHDKQEATDNDNDMDEEEDLNMEYSDSDFEDNLEQRMMHLEGDADIHSLHPSERTVTPLQSGFSSPKYEYSDEENDEDRGANISNYHDTDNHQFEGNISDEAEEHSYDVEEEEEEAEEEADENEDYQPLPPPQELDPEKLYALYAFNGPDPSHCQLEQDEPCVLLNDEDTYWWLVKRCRDNNIGFAPAEILETFPERLARLNCWKNENMTSSTINSLQSIEVINQNEREQQEDLEVKKNSSLALPYQTGKSDKSVSFNDIISYADRYIDEGSDADEEVNDENIDNKKDSDDADDDELSSKVKEDKKVTKYTHIDKFTNEVISYRKRNDIEENNSDVVSDVSFNTGYAQPLNMVKIRESKSIKNIHNQIVIEAPKRHEELNQWSDIQGLGISDNKDDDDHTATGSEREDHSDTESEVEPMESLQIHKEEHISNDCNGRDTTSTTAIPNVGTSTNQDHDTFTSEQQPVNASASELHKIFEAPVIPFGKDNEGKIKNSTSDYSISTIGEFSPSSSEWTNDSPNLKTTDEMASENETFNSELKQAVIPSTRAVQDISKLVDGPPSPSEVEGDGTVVTSDANASPVQDNLSNDSLPGKKATAPSPVSGVISSPSMDTLSSVEEEYKLYMEDRELQASTTSVASNTSSHKTQTVTYIPETTIREPTLTRSDSLPEGYQHPMVQKMYSPILSKIDILMNKIDDIVQQQ